MEARKLARGIVEVELIEHAVLPVGSQGRPVGRPESLSLPEKTHQIGLSRNLLGTEPSRGPDGRIMGKPRPQLIIAEHRELLALLLGPIETVVDVIGTHGIMHVADGHDVQTAARLERDSPVVAGHARHDVVVRERPVGADVAVFNPDVRVMRVKVNLGDGILNKNRRMGFAIMVHNLPLIADDILQREGRRNHLAGSAEMIELATRERHYGHGQLAQGGVVERGMRAQRTSEVGIQVVEGHLLARNGRQRLPAVEPRHGIDRNAARHEQTDGTVAEQPDADVGQIELLPLERLKLFHGRLLKHLAQDMRRRTVGNEDTVIAGHGSIEPKAVADDIGLGHRRQRLRGADVDIATDDHRVESLGRHRHDALVERQLERQEVLRQTLASLPPEHGDGRQDFPRRRIAGQSAALSAGMQQDASLAAKPIAEADATGLLGGTEVGLQQQPRRAATAANAMALRIAGTEILIGGQTGNLVEYGRCTFYFAHQIGRQRQQFLHGLYIRDY